MKDLGFIIDKREETFFPKELPLLFGVNMPIAASRVKTTQIREELNLSKKITLYSPVEMPAESRPLI